jgi:predicted dehydrogenase
MMEGRPMTTQKKRVRIGIVGAGRFSQARLLPEFAKIPGVEFVAVANSTVESGQKVADKFGVKKVHADWREVTSSPDVDVVYNGTRGEVHRDILLSAIQNDKHVFTMNPLAMTAAEGREFVAELKKRPHLKARQCPAFPHGPYTRQDEIVRRLLKEGRIGTVLAANVFWNTPYLALGSYFEVPYRWLGDHKRVLGYRRQFEVGGKRVGITTALADTVGGALVTYSHSNATAPAAANPRIELVGETGAIIVQASPAKGEAVLVSGMDDKAPKQVPVPADLKPIWESEQQYPIEKAFIDWVQGGPQPSAILLSFEDGLKGLEFAEAFVSSMQQGGVWVDVPQH